MAHQNQWTKNDKSVQAIRYNSKCVQFLLSTF